MHYLIYINVVIRLKIEVTTKGSIYSVLNKMHHRDIEPRTFHSQKEDSITILKVILYSYLILKKMNERIKYIPSYIFDNEGKLFKKLKKLAVSRKCTMFKY